MRYSIRINTTVSKNLATSARSHHSPYPSPPTKIMLVKNAVTRESKVLIQMLHQLFALLRPIYYSSQNYP